MQPDKAIQNRYIINIKTNEMILYYRFQRLLITLFSMPFNWIAMVINHVEYGKGFRACGCLYIRNWGTMQLGKGISINSHRIADPIGGDTKTMLLCGKGARMVLHDGVSISNSTIFCNNHIEIQRDTCIGGVQKSMIPISIPQTLQKGLMATRMCLQNQSLLASECSSVDIPLF